MICKYCESRMATQGTDRIGSAYSELFVCINEDCRGVYETWRTLNGQSLADKNRWFNPKTKEFEN